MLYLQFAPPPALAPYVECFWTVRTWGKPALPGREVLIPDGTTELLLNFGGPYARFAGPSGGTGETVSRSHIIGIRGAGVFIEQASDQEVFAIRFRPGGVHPFLRVPMAELAGRSTDLEGLMGAFARELEERVAEAATPDERVRTAAAALLQRLAEPGETEARIRRAAATIFAERGARTVDRVGERLGMGYRALDRAFARYVGLSPKRLSRIARFNHALNLARTAHAPTLSRVAHAAGYADQAHMIRDFHEFTGTTPGDFLRRSFTVTQVIQEAIRERMSNSYNPES